MLYGLRFGMKVWGDVFGIVSRFIDGWYDYGWEDVSGRQVVGEAS